MNIRNNRNNRNHNHIQFLFCRNRRFVFRGLIYFGQAQIQWSVATVFQNLEMSCKKEMDSGEAQQVSQAPKAVRWFQEETTGGSKAPITVQRGGQETSSTSSTTRCYAQTLTVVALIVVNQLSSFITLLENVPFVFDHLWTQDIHIFSLTFGVKTGPYTDQWGSTLKVCLFSNF